ASAFQLSERSEVCLTYKHPNTSTVSHFIVKRFRVFHCAAGEIALHTGMANRIGTLADAQAWAAEIARLAPLAIQHAKRVLNDDGAIEEAWPAHKELFDKAWGSQDVIEAQVARMEKRPPKFQGA
ncbi:hypothetical protein ABLN72_14535, partial [Mycobacterium tuberculosis]